MASFFVELLSAVLLFSLVFGMSATVEISHMQKQMHNSTALLIGAGLQFVILPFVGFLTVKIFALPAEVGITLLVITSSPGGSYSNWWCSMFNADLALSVTMTALSTLLSTIMLPANLVIYTRWTYSAAVVKSLDWMALFVSLAVVIGGIASGLAASHWANTTGNAVAMHRRANRMGNLSGLALILLSVTFSSTGQTGAIWDQDATFYVACAFPPVIGLILAVSLATYYQLDKPERVAVSVEACYQNTGLATLVALTMFQTETELATAIGVPLYYGMVEAAVICTFCLICWKSGWTKAPANENLCTVIATSYEVECMQDKEQESTAIEVVLSAHEVGDKNYLIFSQSAAGDYLVDEETLQDIEKGMRQKEAKQQANESSIGFNSDDPTECSECSHHEEDVRETDGIMILASPVSLMHRRQRSLYDALEAPESPRTETSSVSSEHDLCATDSGAQPQHKIRFGRRAMSGMVARATGYRPQVSLTKDEDEHDEGVHNPRDKSLSIDLPVDNEGKSDESVSRTKAAVAKAAETSKSAVIKVAASVSNRRIRRKYETVSTTASPSNEPGPLDSTLEDESESSDDAVDDCSL
jgi:predicted Na+-dependent transporter